MRKIIISTLSLSLILFALQASAQDDLSSKEAMALCKKAEKMIRSGSEQFVQAEIILEQAVALAPENAAVNLAMGRAQLNGPHREKAADFLVKAQKADPTIPHISYLAGYALQLNARWDEAIAMYEEHLAVYPDNEQDERYNLSDKHIVECRNGKLAIASPVNVRIENMSAVVNSIFADYGPLVSADGTQLFFTSRRPSSTGDKVNKVNSDYFEDIYFSSQTNGEWSEAQPMSLPLNTDKNDACVGMFNDARTLIVYRDESGGGDLFETNYDQGVWSTPIAFNANINTPAHESSAWYSYDRQWLYFVSNRPEDSQGGQDIFRSPWDPTTNNWGEAENLGPTVNTKYDEDGIFVHPDGKTIYFSSHGHNSVGGFDIFRSRLENGAWTTPENLGWPVNSPDDDLFFVLTADGRTGYFSSYRYGGEGVDDLYRVEFGAGDEFVSMNNGGIGVVEDAGTVMLKGVVNSSARASGMAAVIELVDLASAEPVANFKSDGATGEFLVTVPAGKEYAMYVKAEGYLPHSKNISVPNGKQLSDLDVVITLESLTSGSTVAMRNIFFNSSSAELEQSSLAELNQLNALLKDNANLRLLIEGHTDNTGSKEMNKTLSLERASAVRDHLIKRGIKADRLEVAGVGDAKPLAPNTNETNKALNRRTEVIVL